MSNRNESVADILASDEKSTLCAFSDIKNHPEIIASPGIYYDGFRVDIWLKAVEMIIRKKQTQINELTSRLDKLSNKDRTYDPNGQPE